ncbi:ribosome biogenesis GTPase YlqF [Pontibacillus yanchengensis]|uniref:Ribosome biogenesis GTPase A n=2 Tax=Pontibacillus yanchengensis TaxID=462910 RepID=A0A6I4ZVF4_9BACI|nr:ribosome biogenesis GTPase YlqF [Pontibacillus yanchengensis]MYL33124.1 ribosome biogenesis GTPase YlqF [Pontibacillus yanchengensis]MYL52026.1 ribosome biogenesis GTPase YlqF [Pontibacillus yanchengensis]
MTIQWFPGHMAKAKREVEEKLKLVDFIIELVDARAPYSSQNPMLHQVLNQKTKMVLLMKKDLADAHVTEQWVQWYEEKGIIAIPVDVQQQKDIQSVVQQAKELGNEKLEKLRKKGVRPRPARAMILGIPNVGKSTLINRLAKKKIAKIGDKPGVTQAQQWIKVKKDFELLDTPGILWPKFEDEIVGYRLASIGTIKDNILPIPDVAAFIIRFLQAHYSSALKERYGLPSSIEEMGEAFEHIGEKRGCLESGGNVNFDKVADIIIRDLRSNKLGAITLETPEVVEQQETE